MTVALREERGGTETTQGHGLWQVLSLPCLWAPTPWTPTPTKSRPSQTPHSGNREGPTPAIPSFSLHTHGSSKGWGLPFTPRANPAPGDIGAVGLARPRAPHGTPTQAPEVTGSPAHNLCGCRARSRGDRDGEPDLGKFPPRTEGPQASGHTARTSYVPRESCPRGTVEPPRLSLKNNASPLQRAIKKG